MTKNMGMVDRALRVSVGLFCIAMLVFGELVAPWNWVAGIVAVLTLATSSVAFCPAYTIFGIKTCKTKTQ